MSQPPPLPPQVIQYATPTDYLKPTTAWRDGDLLIIPTGCALPMRCVKCNGPAEPYFTWRKKVMWFHPAYYFLLLPCLTLILAIPAVLLYMVVVAIVGKTYWVEAGLCEKHGRWFQRRARIAWGLGLLGVGLLIGAIFNEAHYRGNHFSPVTSLLIVLGLSFFFLGLLWQTTMVKLLWPKRIDQRHAVLLGAGAEFLTSLPTPGSILPAENS